MGIRRRRRFHFFNDSMVELIRELDKVIDRGGDGQNFSSYGNKDETHIPLSSLLNPQSSNRSNSLVDIRQPTIRPLPEMVTMLIAYSLIVLMSLFGNIIVCHVIYKNRRLHTVTNLFISNLAVSDVLITVLNIPFTIVRNVMNEWIFGEIICHVVNFALMVSVYVSTYTMAGIAIDRYIVILYPLRPRITWYVGIVVIVITWMIGCLMSLPFAIYAQVQEVELFLKTVTRCRICYPEPSETYEKFLTLMTVISQYLFPMILIGVAYGQIVRKLWVRDVVGQQTEKQQINRDRIKRKTIKMLIIVVIIFCVCWMPLNLYHILTDFHPDKDLFHYNSKVYLACHWLAMSSVCYNPFIYCWLNESFRKAMLSKFKWMCRRRSKIYPGVEVDGLLVRMDRIPQNKRTNSNGTSASIKSGASKIHKAHSIERIIEQRQKTSDEEDNTTSLHKYACGSLMGHVRRDPTNLFCTDKARGSTEPDFHWI